MQDQAEIADLKAQLRDVQNKLTAIQVLLMQKAQSDNMLGDWLSEQDAITLTGLKKTRLYELRMEGKITSSTLGSKAVFYRISDFKALLNENKRKR